MASYDTTVVTWSEFYRHYQITVAIQDEYSTISFLKK